MSAKIVVAGAIFKVIEGIPHILLVKKKTLDYYIFPGSKQTEEEKESADYKATLKREIREELNCGFSREPRFLYIERGKAPNGDPIYMTDIDGEPTCNAEIEKLWYYNLKTQPLRDYPFTQVTELVVNHFRNLMDYTEASLVE